MIVLRIMDFGHVIMDLKVLAMLVSVRFQGTKSEVLS